jgi:class 3 adenylate cyclase
VQALAHRLGNLGAEFLAMLNQVRHAGDRVGRSRGRSAGCRGADVTYIVGSTSRAASLGGRSWRELLDRHNAVVRRALGQFRGHEVDTAGDGFMAALDGPVRACAAARRSSRACATWAWRSVRAFTLANANNRASA